MLPEVACLQCASYSFVSATLGNDLVLEVCPRSVSSPKILCKSSRFQPLTLLVDWCKVVQRTVRFFRWLSLLNVRIKRGGGESHLKEGNRALIIHQTSYVTVTWQTNEAVTYQTSLLPQRSLLKPAPPPSGYFSNPYPPVTPPILSPVELTPGLFAEAKQLFRLKRVASWSELFFVWSELLFVLINLKRVCFDKFKARLQKSRELEQLWVTRSTRWINELRAVRSTWSFLETMCDATHAKSNVCNLEISPCC